MNSTTLTPIGAVPLVGEQLERRLEDLLHQDRFVPAPLCVGGGQGQAAIIRNGVGG